MLSKLALAAVALNVTLAPHRLLAEEPAKPAAPDWVIPGTIIEMDFEHNRYYGANLDDLAITRPSEGYASAKSGLLQRFEPNQLRLTDLGLLIEIWQRNELLWSRDLTKDVWVKTNLKIEPAPMSADGVKGMGTRLTATADNATIYQVIHNSGETTIGYSGPKDTNPTPGGGTIQFLCYAKRVSGHGPLRFVIGNGDKLSPGGDISQLLNPDGYTQVTFNSANVPEQPFGIRIGTAGDVFDVDMLSCNLEGLRDILGAASPFPTTDKKSWRDADMVTVKPASKLYKALAGTKGTVYVKTFNLLGGDPAAIFMFESREHRRELAAWIGATPIPGIIPAFSDGPCRSSTKVGSIGNYRFANVGWKIEVSKQYPAGFIPMMRSMLTHGITVSAVATWGDGESSIVANNGPLGTGTCTDTEASGTLYIGYGGHEPGGMIHDTNYPRGGRFSDGYIQDIAFFPEIVEGYGAKLTVGPETSPAGAFSKLPMPHTWARSPFTDSRKVEVTCPVSGVQIYYTLDGSEPDQTKTLYKEPFELKETTTVKTRAYKTGHTESELYEVAFTKTQPK